MKLNSVALAATALLCLVSFLNPRKSQAETTISCPAGTYDMLDWMTMDSDLRATRHLTGSSNPIFSTVWPDKFYWVKGSKGYPWDIQLYDDKFIYLWITEYAWNTPTTFKKFSSNKNVPLAPRCAKGGFPGSTIKVSNTAYDINTSCSSSTRHNLKKGVNQVWGPYSSSFGGDLPKNMSTLVVTYRYNCNDAYQNCGDKEEYYLSKRYGLVQWVHYTLVKGSYQQQKKSLFNDITEGTATPKFQCF